MSNSELTTTNSAAEVAEYLASLGAPAGLEDMNSSDIAMSKVSIVHTEGVFEDSLTGEKFDTLDTVMLGIIKGRVLWHTDVDYEGGPLCKSYDAETGHPQTDFPEKAFAAKGGTHNADGTIVCETCPLAAWGSDPINGKRPWCTEQMTVPITIGGDDPAGTITFQRSGVGPMRAYASSYLREKRPMFTHRTKVTLEKGRKGTVVFSTPKFVRGEAVNDIGLLKSYAEAYERIKEIWQTPRRDDDEGAATTPALGAVVDGTVVEDELPPF